MLLFVLLALSSVLLDSSHSFTVIISLLLLPACFASHARRPT